MADKKKTKDGYVAKGTYFDAGLSDADRAAVEDLSRQWKEYQAAGDQAGMDKTHQAAQAIRSGYGYSGGGDGSEYIPIPREEQKASTPGDWIGGGGTALGGSGKGSVGSWGGGRFTYEQAPEYASKYQKQIDELTAEILGRPAFEYDPFKDPTYQQYEQSYREGGKRAMQDTLGQASARSGGLASSYADRVSQQTYDQYMSALADKIPELRQLAYEMYRDELNGKRADLSMLTGLDDSAYNKFLTTLGQYNTDRSFDYGMFGDAVGRDQWQREFDRGVLESDRDFAYGVSRDQVADERYGTEWDYKVQQDALSRGDQDRQEAISRIYNYLQAGGTVAGLPQELVQSSGLSTMELEALAADFAKQRSQSDQQFAADLAASKAATAAKYASSSKTSSGGGSGGSSKDKYQDKSSNYYRIQKQAAGYDDVEDVQAYLDRMIDQGYITAEEAAEMFTLDLGWNPDDLSGMEEEGGTGGTPKTYKEFSAATGNPKIYTQSEFQGHKSRGSSSVAKYKDYQDYLAQKYREYMKEG